MEERELRPVGDRRYYFWAVTYSAALYIEKLGGKVERVQGPGKDGWHVVFPPGTLAEIAILSVPGSGQSSELEARYQISGKVPDWYDPTMKHQWYTEVPPMWLDYEVDAHAAEQRKVLYLPQAGAKKF